MIFVNRIQINNLDLISGIRVFFRNNSYSLLRNLFEVNVSPMNDFPFFIWEQILHKYGLIDSKHSVHIQLAHHSQPGITSPKRLFYFCIHTNIIIFKLPINIL